MRAAPGRLLAPRAKAGAIDKGSTNVRERLRANRHKSLELGANNTSSGVNTIQDQHLEATIVAKHPNTGFVFRLQGTSPLALQCPAVPGFPHGDMGEQ